MLYLSSFIALDLLQFLIRSSETFNYQKHDTKSKSFHQIYIYHPFEFRFTLPYTYKTFLLHLVFLQPKNSLSNNDIEKNIRIYRIPKNHL